MVKLPQIGQGPAKEVNADDIQHDKTGFTNPNLHRRIHTPPDGVGNRKYKIGIYGFNSYRTTEIIVHDEESTISEIP